MTPAASVAVRSPALAKLTRPKLYNAELRCTAEEAEAILGSQKLDREHLQRQQQSDGWVAALVLLREHSMGGWDKLEQRALIISRTSWRCRW